VILEATVAAIGHITERVASGRKKAGEDFPGFNDKSKTD
jgi:hypothetical protein